MTYRILFLGDLHKRDLDFSTINGYTTAVDAVQADILQFIKDRGITHLVSLGDWYDKGYRSINRANNDRNWDEELSAAVGGNFYICLGNHFFLERDNNPEMYLIQPSELYKPTHEIYATKPIIKAPASFRVGSIQVSLFHYSKAHKLYKTVLDPDVTYHVGIYHDEVVVPTWAQKEGGLIGGSPGTRIEEILDNVNLAIVGHIHKPVGAIKVPVNGHEVPMIIPGSLSNTSNGPAYHDSVKLPVLEIQEGATRPSCMLYQFTLHCEMLRLYRKKETAVKMETPAQAIADIPKTIGVKDYLRAKGYEDAHVSLVEAAAEGAVDPLTGLQLLNIVRRNTP